MRLNNTGLSTKVMLLLVRLIIIGHEAWQRRTLSGQWRILLRLVSKRLYLRPRDVRYSAWGKDSWSLAKQSHAMMSTISVFTIYSLSIYN